MNKLWFFLGASFVALPMSIVTILSGSVWWAGPPMILWLGAFVVSTTLGPLEARDDEQQEVVE